MPRHSDSDVTTSYHHSVLMFNDSERCRALRYSLDELSCLVRDLLTISQGDSLERIACIVSKLDESRGLLLEIDCPESTDRQSSGEFNLPFNDHG